MSLPIHSVALEASRILKAGPGSLLSLLVCNDGPAQFIQLHDSKTVPADTAIPVAVFHIAADSSANLAQELRGLTFATGIVVCNSSTLATKTVGAADCYFTANLSR